MPASEQGINLDRYMLIPRVLVFVTRAGRLLLLRGAPGKRLWAERYNGLGGHVEQGEDPLSAARRELLEEANLTASLRLCGTLFVDSGQNPGVAVLVYAGEVTGGELRNSDEGVLEWVEPGALDSLPVVEDLPILVQRLLQMQAEDPPFSARSFYDDKGQLKVVFAE
jgi:8-oxo-dGTP diphosphatase